MSCAPSMGASALSTSVTLGDGAKSTGGDGGVGASYAHYTAWLAPETARAWTPASGVVLGQVTRDVHSSADVSRVSVTRVSTSRTAGAWMQPSVGVALAIDAALLLSSRPALALILRVSAVAAMPTRRRDEDDDDDDAFEVPARASKSQRKTPQSTRCYGTTRQALDTASRFSWTLPRPAPTASAARCSRASIRSSWRRSLLRAACAECGCRAWKSSSRQAVAQVRARPSRAAAMRPATSRGRNQWARKGARAPLWQRRLLAG